MKDNIIEFLNILKDDKVPQVKEICFMTLNFIEGKTYFRHDFPKFLSIGNNSNENDFNFNHIINQQSGCGRPELSISFSENNGNVSKEDISFSDQRININNNNNHIIDNYFNKNIDLNGTKKSDNFINKNTDNIENNDNLNDENVFNRFLKCRNYSCDINKNVDFNLEKTEQPKYKTIKKITNLNKNNNKNKESNCENSLKISKLSYNI